MPAAVAAAVAALPTLATTPPRERARWLRVLADRLDGDRDRLVPIARRETSLTTQRLDGEVTRTTNQLRMFADVLEDGNWTHPILVPGSDATGTPDVRRTVIPLGPVAVFPAGNFPFAFGVTGGDTASALAAGCPVVVKVHPGYESLSEQVGLLARQALEDAGAPAGTIGWVRGFEAGRELVQHPGIRAVGFTGSLSGGRSLLDLANQRPDPVPFYGELGSLNPVLVTPAAAEARPDDIATGLVASFTMGAGQFCTKPGLVFVPRESTVPELVAQAVPRTHVEMLSQRIADGYQQGTATLRGDSRLHEVGESTLESDGAPTPVVLLGSIDDFAGPDGLGPLDEECFGPVTVLLTYADPSQVVDLLPSLPGSLTFSIHGEDDDLDWLRPILVELMSVSGRLVWNGWPTGVAVNAAMHHGGPWPATTNPLHTSVGSTAIMRFLRPIAFQDWPEHLLPEELRTTTSYPGPRWIPGGLPDDQPRGGASPGTGGSQ